MTKEAERIIEQYHLDITRAAEAALIISQDLCEDYFEQYDHETDGTFIINEFNRHRVKMNILQDAITAINQAIKAINDTEESE